MIKERQLNYNKLSYIEPGVLWPSGILRGINKLILAYYHVTDNENQAGR